MAEFDTEGASLDLFQEIFNARSGVDVVGKTVNNIVVDSNVNKYSSSNSNFLKSSVVSNNIDNGTIAQADDSAGLIEESTDEDVQDSVVRLNNIENLKKKNESTNGSSSSLTVVMSDDDNKDDCVGDDDSVNDYAHNNAVNGNANTELNSDDKTCGKQKRGISFPKDTFISGYFEPPDPWKNAPSWTTDELVLAYKKSCELHGTKPIAKLVQQLQACSSGKQEDLLSLKGEKLDQKQCECLEEVLRRVQFKLLDLEASHLDDECAVALFDMIEYYESACQLNIACNKNIQARGWQACSRLVRRTPNLTYLDLRSCDLNDRNIPIFGRALKLGCHLTILHMESMNLSGRPLVILIAALKMNETLQELFLAENKLMPTDGVQLGNLLRYNNKLSLLDLRNNHLQDVGTSHISDGLMEQVKRPGLRTLVLWSNSINYQAMPALGRALAVSENLETLNIGHNALTNEGVHLLKDGLLKTNSLLRLGLQGTKITDEGAVALAEYIADSIILLRIDLRDNEIKTGGLMALSHAMRVNTSVTRIDLDKEPKKESSMKDYAEQQSHLLRDIATFQQRNIQAALKKEEQERAELEEKAEAATPACQEEAQDEQVTETVLAAASAQSCSLFETEKDEEVLEEDIEHEKDKKDAENVKAKNIGEKLKESQFVESDTDELDSSPDMDELDASVSKVDAKNRQRPSVLFPYLGLPPQASLDSPLPTSNISPLVSVFSESASVPQQLIQSRPPSQKGLLTLNMGSAPGEMILSPQYFPKQIARKIFSVSRVNEDPSWPPLSTSPTPPNPLSTVYDPLNVSPIPLVPLTSLVPPPSTSPLLLPQCTLGVSQHSKTTLQTSANPSSSLFQNLAEETVRHMVSPLIDIDVKSLLVQNIDAKKITDNIENLSVESNSVPVFSESSDTSIEFSSILQQETMDKRLPVSHNIFESCDNLEYSGFETGRSLASVSLFKEDLCETNSWVENLVVIPSEIKNKEMADFPHVVLGTLQQEPFLIPESILGDACMTNALNASDSLHKVDSCDVSSDSCYENDFSALAKTSENIKGNPETDISKNEIVSVCDNHPSEGLLFPTENNLESTVSHSELRIPNAAYFDKGAGDDSWQGKDVPENEEFSQHKQQHAAEIFNENCLMDLNEQYSLTTVIDINTSEKLVSAGMNNSNSPSLLLSEDNKELSSARHKKISEAHSFESLGNEEQPSSLFEDSSGATGHRKDMREKDSGFSLKASNASGCAESLADAYNSSNDNITIENMDFNLEEEPWLAVGAENDGSGTDKFKETLTQPDFFTTLSMNGLTQELTNALTSMDGSSTSNGNEDDNLDLRPHDEFEKELDALLALVQSELPWPLKDS